MERQEGAEISAILQSLILSFNEQCSSLLGSSIVHLPVLTSILLADLRTRYESSILLWEKFLSLSGESRQWVDEGLDRAANISASSEAPASLVSQLEVRNKMPPNYSKIYASTF